MKPIILLFTFISATAQNQWNQDFISPFSFSEFAIQGDTLDFQVDSANTLKLQALPQTHSSFLAFPSSSNHLASYEFDLSLGFNPSSSNYAKVFVWSDDAIPSQANNGVYVSIGGSTEDRLSLYGLSQGQSVLLVESNADFLNESTLQLRIKVEVDSLGNYHLWAKKGIDSNQYLGNGFFYSQAPSHFFTIECFYTATRSDKFTFDQISVNGTQLEDKDGPKILRIRTNNRKEIVLNFSLDVDTLELKDPDHFELQPGNHKPKNLKYKALRQEVTLCYDQSLIDSLSYTLQLTSIPDQSGNMLDTSIVGVRFYQAKKGDILFSEILFDAVPPVQLPEEEGIEIYNRRSFPIQLDGWILSNGNTSLRINSFRIEGKSFGWITDKPESWLTHIPEEDILQCTLGPNFLLTEEGQISIADSTSVIVDRLQYSKQLFESEPKKLGGWTLERTVLTSPCGSSNFWSESNHLSGGTPGRKNSNEEILVDEEAPYLKYYGKRNDSTLQLFWNEEIHLTGIPSITEGSAILDSFWINPLLASELFLQFEKSAPNSSSIGIEFGSNISDCIGNSSSQQTLQLSFPEPILTSGLYIDEILFDPEEGQVEFVELVNRSAKTYDLKGVRFWIASDTLSPQRNSSSPLEMSRIIQAGERICLAKQVPNRREESFYSSKQYFIEVHDFPNLLSTESSIGITNLSLENLDKASYDQEFHSTLLNESKGFSLQRISFENEAHRIEDWISSNPSPGVASEIIKEGVSHQISLNEDCWKRNENTELQIVLNDTQKPALLDLSLYALNGRELCKITERQWIRGSANIVWSGTGNRGESILPGIYFIVAYIYTENGVKVREVHPFSICD